MIPRQLNSVRIQDRHRQRGEFSRLISQFDRHDRESTIARADADRSLEVLRSRFRKELFQEECFVALAGNCELSVSVGDFDSVLLLQTEVN